VQDPVLILGATGAIGGAIAKRLAAKGPVVVHGRNENKLALLKNELSSSNKYGVGPKAQSFYMEEMKIN